MIELHNLTKIYNEDLENQVIALDHVSFTLPESGMVFLLGKSGSGKTTMLNVLGGLDAPTEGELRIDGTSSKNFRQKDWDAYRNNYVGFVFQEYNLLDDLTIGANIALALNLQGKISKADAEQKIATVLAQVGLSGYGSRKPSELSGGQKQRIAIARALVKNPQMILADEPTGALDSENGQQIFDLLKAIAAEKLVVIVSHDEESARRYADRIIELADGNVIADSARPGIRRVTYHPDTVLIPPMYAFTDEEWAKVQAYMEACLRDENPESPVEETQEEAPVSMVETVENQRVFQTQKSRLPLRTALHLGLQGMKQKKIRLAITSMLCVVAFMLVCVSDMLMAYSWRNTLINSLYTEQPAYTTLDKEYYNDYNYTKVCLPLPTEEAVKHFNGESTITVESGIPGWYGDYMFTDEDLTEISRKTGQTVKGVYVPGGADMSLEPNYGSLYMGTDIGKTEAGRIPETITGFVEMTEDELDDLGMTLLAGIMPAGGTNEIAISKYLYEAFMLTQYRSYEGPMFVVEWYEDYYYAGTPFLTEKYSWEEYMKIGSILRSSNIKKLRNGFAGNVSMYLADRGFSFSTIDDPEDMIGHSLFLGNRLYTITGVIDTGLDTSRYSGISKSDLKANAAELDRETRERVAEIKQEQQSGFACVAFVGQGSITKISKEYPVAVTMDNMKFTVENKDVRYNIDTLISKATIPYELYKSIKENAADNWFFASQKYYEDLIDKPNVDLKWNRVHSQDEIAHLGLFEKNGSLAMLSSDNHVTYTDTGWSYDMAAGNASSSYDIDYISDVYPIIDAIILNPFTFTLLTEGRAGQYAFAISTVPSEKRDITNFVDSCYDESGTFRYPLNSTLVRQLDSMHQTLINLASIFRYVGIAMVLFALVMFSNFIITSINQRKRQIGIMRALGAGSGDVFSVFFTEGLLVAVVSAVLAFICTAVVCGMGNNMLRGELGLRISLLSLDLRQVGIIFTLSFGIAIVASIIPILRIARQKPVEAIRE